MNEYRAYLERLDHLVSMEVVPKTAIFDYFTSHIYRRDGQPADVEPLLWYLQSAFYSDLTFSIYRFFDKKSDRNIFHFLEQATAHHLSIEWKSPLTMHDLAKQHDRLAQVAPLIENLRKRRNKYFGHYDKQYFYQPDEINVDFPFSNEDAKSLVRVLQSILADHKRALTGAASISIDGFVYVAAEKLYEKLRQCNHAVE